MLFGRVGGVLFKKKSSLADQPTRPLRPVLRRSPVWIRPKCISFELKIFEKSQLFSSRKLTPHLRVRLGLDLLGVAVMLALLGFLIVRIFTINDVSIYSRGDEAKSNCALNPLLPGCKHVSGLGTAVVVTRTAQAPSTGRTPTVEASAVARVTSTPPTPVAVSVTPVPTSRPGVNLTPTPTPIIASTPVPTPDPNPGKANLTATPFPVVLSYANNCMTQQAASVTLDNTGTTVLLWIEDTTRTSPGLNISSPTQLYLLPPGQSALVAISCSPANVVGGYLVTVLYDGGNLQIPVTVIP